MRRTYPRPFWLIARHRTGGMEVLRTILASGKEALPVFSFEDEARMFLELGAPGGDWRARETTAGELTSVLCGLCASVDRVVLDPVPLPGPLIESLNGLLSMEREVFMGTLLNRRRSRSPGSGRPRRRHSSSAASICGSLCARMTSLFAHPLEPQVSLPVARLLGLVRTATQFFKLHASRGL